MEGTPAAAGRRRRRAAVARVAALLVLVVCLLGAAFVVRPTSFFRAAGRFSLWWNGIRDRDLRVGSYRIHYLQAGEGRALVLVHGLGGSSMDWLSTIPEFTRRGFQVYAPDLLGFGRSDAPDVDYSVSRQAVVLARFLDGIGVRQTDLAGISMGGWTSLKLAIESPHRVRRLVLLDSAGMTMPIEEARRVASLLVPHTTADLARLAAAISVGARPMPAFIARDVLRRLAERRWVVRRALDSMLTGSDVMDGKLRGLTMPVLLVWGREDAITPLAAGEAMHREMPQSVLRVIDGCGHIAAYACADRVVPIVAAFLEGH